MRVVVGFYTCHMTLYSHSESFPSRELSFENLSFQNNINHWLQPDKENNKYKY